jgi:cytochrome c biogenesis protein CcdA/thiol-disulfide isomerase/thioredoxin
MILVALTYVAGVLTILSPCILPVLPFVFSRAQGSFLKSGVPLLLGMCFTFSALSAFAIAGGHWISQASEVGRVVAMVLLTVFGLSLIFPKVVEKLFLPFTQAGSKIGSAKKEGFAGSFLIGISTGLLWSPCAGPILGLVLTGAASQKNIGTSVLLLTAYSLGAATSLGLALVAGNKFLGTLKKFLGVDQVVKKVLGVAILLGVLAIAFNLDRTLLTQVSKFETVSLETKLLSLVQPEAKEQKGVGEGEFPDFPKDVTWINSKPLTQAELLGKVVVIDFWTYSCINCLRTLPYVKEWAKKYKDDGLVVIGVHTPEFAFEKEPANVEKAVKDLGISYPVVTDSDYKIWNSFQNHYWPAHFFIDRSGHIRNHHFGEGNYDESEEIIRSLLSENGKTLNVGATKIQNTEGAEMPSSSVSKSPETYVGYARAENFIEDFHNDETFIYRGAKNLKVNQWSLEGSWLVSKEKAILKKPRGKIRFNFHGRDLHLVLGAATKLKFKVTIDGHAPGENHGSDIDASGSGEIQSQRLYQLIRLKDLNPRDSHIFEIEFDSPGAEAYAFTFG